MNVRQVFYVDGQRLKRLRENAGLSQTALAETLNLSYHSIGKFEKNINEPNDETKIALAKYFCVSVDYLLGLTDLPMPDWSDRRYVRIPDKLPDQTKQELDQYMEYLLFKQMKQGSTK